MIDEKKLLEELDNFTMSVGGNANAMALSIIDECRKCFAKIVEKQPKVGEYIPCEDEIPEEHGTILRS